MMELASSPPRDSCHTTVLGVRFELLISKISPKCIHTLFSIPVILFFRSLNIDCEVLSASEIAKVFPLDLRTDDLVVSNYYVTVRSWNKKFPLSRKLCLRFFIFLLTYFT